MELSNFIRKDETQINDIPLGKIKRNEKQQMLFWLYF